jgi:shikimate kinase
MNGRIYLMGIKHSGKSTLGELLAERLNRAFIDLDITIMELFSRDAFVSPASVREIYRRIGARQFHRLEAEAARFIAHEAVLRTPDVVALGGGIIENDSAMKLLDGTGVFLYLLQDEQTLFDRIVRSGIPPFLDTEDPRAVFAELYRRRDSLYRERADRIADIRNLNKTSSLEVLVQLIQE